MNDKTIRKKILGTPKRVERLIYMCRFRHDSETGRGDLNLEIAEFDIVKLVQNVLIC
jgi:two-component system phosphate regulon sensor histidine kinase PhoR